MPLLANRCEFVPLLLGEVVQPEISEGWEDRLLHARSEIEVSVQGMPRMPIGSDADRRAGLS